MVRASSKKGAENNYSIKNSKLIFDFKSIIKKHQAVLLDAFIFCYSAQGCKGLFSCNVGT